MKDKLFSITFLISIILFLAASTVPMTAFWGYDHLAFTSVGFSYGIYFLFVISIYLLFGKLPKTSFENIVTILNTNLFGDKNRYKVLVAIVFGLIFYIFKSENHLLGDGYTLIGNLGQGDYYIHKWAETGSIYFIRFMQQLIGGYTKETALHVFQLLSILSGVLFVYNLFSIFSRLTEDAYWRLFGFGTLSFSGYILLFFGYVEYYPITLAILTSYILFSLLSIQKGKYLLTTTLLWILAFASHVLTSIFLPGLLYLYYLKIHSNQVKKIIGILSITLIPVGIYFYYWLYNNSFAFEILNLPLLDGRPIAPNYTVFSFEHFRDILNLIFLVIPGVLVLLVLSLNVKVIHFYSKISCFLVLSSMGSVSFLMLFGAAITMGRDWDIMSITILFPLLLALYVISKSKFTLNSKHLFAYLILILTMSISFITVATTNEPAEKRFYTLLNSHNRNMWMVFKQYYVEKGKIEKYLEIGKESFEVYPDYVQYKAAYRLLEKNNSEEAYKIAVKLVQNNPYEPDFLQLMAFMYFKQNKLAKSEEFYLKALQLKPYSVVIRDELALVYIVQNRSAEALNILNETKKLSSNQVFLLESLAKLNIRNQDYAAATSIADTLMSYDYKGASHLINMTIMIQTNRSNEAIRYYKLFKRDGTKRTDYQQIVNHYEKFLNE